MTIEFKPWKKPSSLPGLIKEGYRLRQYLNNSKVWFAEGSFDNVKDEGTTNQLHRQLGKVIQSKHNFPSKRPEVSPSYLCLCPEQCPGSGRTRVSGTPLRRSAAPSPASPGPPAASPLTSGPSCNNTPEQLRIAVTPLRATWLMHRGSENTSSLGKWGTNFWTAVCHVKNLQ